MIPGLLLPTANPIGRRLFRRELQAYWPLSEASGTRGDLSGNGNTLTDNNTVTGAAGPSSKLALASQFTAATSESLSIADNARLSALNSDLWLSGFIYFDSLPAEAASMRFVSKWNIGLTDREYQIIVTTTAGVTSFLFVTRDAADLNNVTVTASNFGGISITTWYRFDAWYNRYTDTIYLAINAGVPNVQGSAGGIRDGTAAFTLGTESGAGSGFLDGRMVGVAVRKCVPSTADLTYLYNSGTGRGLLNGRFV